MPNAIADALLPPGSLAIAAFLLLLAGRRWRRLGLALLGVFILLGTGLVSAALLDTLAVPNPPTGPEPLAIVILSADGVIMPPPPLPPLEPGPLTLERMRAGAALQRSTGLPILVSGGSFLGQPATLAAMMTTSLTEDFRVPVRWQESRSIDTWENAQYTAQMLQREGITRVYLVTHFWHMRRAMLAFRHWGLDPVPAPVRPVRPLTWSSYLLALGPSGWQTSYYALHEWVGLVYYALRA